MCIYILMEVLVISKYMFYFYRQNRKSKGKYMFYIYIYWRGSLMHVAYPILKTSI